MFLCYSPTLFYIVLLLSHCALATLCFCWFLCTSCQPSFLLGPWPFRPLSRYHLLRKIFYHSIKFSHSVPSLSYHPTVILSSIICHLWYFSCCFFCLFVLFFHLTSFKCKPFRRRELFTSLA